MTFNLFWLAASGALILGPVRLRAQGEAFDAVTADKTDRVVCYHHARYIVVQRRGKEVEYFLGLRGDVLFIDSGTGPDFRGLIVIDLRTRRQLLHTDYVSRPVPGPDVFTIGIWRGSELAKLAPGCPDTGMIPGIDSLFWIDLRSGAMRFAKRTRCA